MKISNRMLLGSLLSAAVVSLAACAPNTNQSQSKPSTPPKKTVKTVKPVKKTPPAQKKTASNSPLPGDLLIADRGNSRLLIVNPDHKVVWQIQIPVTGNGGVHSRGADDAFFTPDGQHIIINEEDNQMLALIDPLTKKIVWTYGHQGIEGSAPGYLHTPDDAYMLPNGDISVADIGNQRILFINQKGHVIKQYGETGVRWHHPPYAFAAPNGDTPLPDGGVLVTEIGGSYADRISKTGKLLYSVHFPYVAYPSDTQLLPNGNLLVVDYSTPGRVEEVTPKGRVVFDYYRTSGWAELSHPSLGIPLSNGNIAVNDDYNDRVVVINPHTHKIVWQYGHTGVAGKRAGYLNTPDGMDMVPSTSPFYGK